MLDWKYYKNTVKSNVLEGFTVFMAKNVLITVCLTGNIGKHCQKLCFGRISYIYVGVGYRHWNMEKLKKTLYIAVFSTVGEIRELDALSNMMFSTGFMVTKV